MNKIHSVCLIIDSDFPFTAHYENQRNLWKKYMNLDPEIKCYLVRLNESISNEIVVDEDNNTIYIRGKESYTPGILIKTLKAMQYVYNKYDFKYLIRTNLSTFWNFPCYKRKFHIPVDNIVEAVIGYIDNVPFPSGYGMVISRDIILKMITLQNQFDYTLNDDVAIGNFLFSKKIPIINAEKYVYPFISPLSLNEILSKIHSKIGSTYQFRIVYDRNTQDKFVYSNLYNLLYAKNARNYLS